MRKIRIIEDISLDGVIQAPGGKGEDGDYPYGKPFFSERNPTKRTSASKLQSVAPPA